jgi:hypothetical protein
MNNADTPTAAILSVQPGQRVRILGDANPDQTYTITEVNPVGKTGKQFRCALLCGKTGQVISGVAPSRLAPPYAAKGTKTYTIEGFTFRPEVVDYPPSSPDVCFHPAMHLAGLINAVLGAELMDLVIEAAEKGTTKAHSAVVMFCVDLLPVLPTPKVPRTFLDKLRFGFNQPSEPNYAPFLTLAVAKIHADAFRYGGK